MRREVWRGQPWSALPVVVIQDDAELLAVHLAVGSPFGFVDSHPLGVHPWSTSESWQGLDVVMLHRPDDEYSVWFFGPFAVYINLQEPYRRTRLGFDTFDHELDIVIGPDGRWEFKDEDRLPIAVDTGRFTATEVDSIRRTGNAVGDMLNNDEAWWDPSWAQWTPPDDWPATSLPPAWADQ